MKLLVFIISAALLLTGCLYPKPESFYDLKKKKALHSIGDHRPGVYENSLCRDNIIDFLGLAVNEGEKVCVDGHAHQRCYIATGQVAQAKEFLLNCAAMKYSDVNGSYADRSVYSSRYAAALLDCALDDKADIYIRYEFKRNDRFENSSKDFLTVDCRNLGLEDRKEAFVYFDSMLPTFRDVKRFHWKNEIKNDDIGALIESRGKVKGTIIPGVRIPDETKEKLQGIRKKVLEMYVEHGLQSPNHMQLVFSAINTYGLFSTIEEYKPILKKHDVSLSEFTKAINMAYVEDNSEYSFELSKLSINEQHFAKKYLIKDYERQLARKNKQEKIAVLKFCQSNPYPTSELNKFLGSIKQGCKAKYKSYIREAKKHNIKEPIYGSDLYRASKKIRKCLDKESDYYSLEDDYKSISDKAVRECNKSDNAIRMTELFKQDLALAKDGFKNYSKMDSVVRKISSKLSDLEAEYESNQVARRQRSNSSELKDIMEGWVPGGSNTKLQEIQNNQMKWLQNFQKNQNIRQQSQSKYIDNSSKATASNSSRSQNNTPIYTSVSSGSKTTKSKPKKITARKKTNSCWSGYENGTGCLVTEEDKFRGNIYSVKYRNQCERRIYAKYCNLISGDKMDCGASGIAPGKTKIWSTKNGSGQHRQIYTGSLKGSEDFVCANEVSGWNQFPN